MGSCFTTPKRNLRVIHCPKSCCNYPHQAILALTDPPSKLLVRSAKYERGACYSKTMNRRKPFLPIPRQLDLLSSRGLTLPDREAVASFLMQHNYYRFSGYMRYFQVAPSHGNEDFEPNTHWGDIVEIYNLDVQLRALLFEGIHLAEISARTAFAYSEANIHSPYEEYLATDAYKRPPNPTIKATNELILSELHRSREPYIAKFRKGCTDVNQLWTDDVPVWAAVETLSLGTLSKAISFRNDGNAVYQGTCKALGVGQPYLSPQLRSFTFIRNKCAHSSRLWNCFVVDPPRVPEGVKRRAERLNGSYAGNSVFAVIVALDYFLFTTKLREGFLNEYLQLASTSELFSQGISHPRAS